MNMKSILYLSLSLLLFTSCVTNKKYVYLQKEDVNKKKLPDDTVVREYAAQDFEYKIQAEDILSIRFESLTPREYDFFATDGPSSGQALGQQANPLLIGELVDAEGTVPFPVIGKVKVAGLTVYQAQDTLQQIANLYLEKPLVKVRLINFRITILGEVGREGTVIFPNNRVTMMEAIGLVGGLTDLADKRNIKLLRQQGNRVEVQYLDLLSEEFVSSPYYFVHQNDVLIVPPLRQRPYRKYVGQNLSLLVSLTSLIVTTLTLTSRY